MERNCALTVSTLLPSFAEPPCWSCPGNQGCHFALPHAQTCELRQTCPALRDAKIGKPVQFLEHDHKDRRT